MRSGDDAVCDTDIQLDLTEQTKVSDGSIMSSAAEM